MFLPKLLFPLLFTGIASAQSYEGLAKLNGYLLLGGSFGSEVEFSPATAPTSLEVDLDADAPSLTATNVEGVSGSVITKVRSQVSAGFGDIRTLTGTVTIEPIRVSVPQIGPQALSPGLQGYYYFGQIWGSGTAVLRGSYSVSDGVETVTGTFDKEVDVTAKLEDRLYAGAYPTCLLLQWERPLAFNFSTNDVVSTSLRGVPITIHMSVSLFSAPVLRLVNGTAAAERVTHVGVGRGKGLKFSLTNIGPGSDKVNAQVITRVRLLKHKSSEARKHRNRAVKVECSVGGGQATRGRNVVLQTQDLEPGMRREIQILLSGRTFPGNRYRVTSTVIATSRLYWEVPAVARARTVMRGAKR